MCWCGNAADVPDALMPKKVEIRPGSQKTARRATKRPPTGKPKLSRVTSGHKGTYDPGPKMGPRGRPEARRATGSKKMLSFWCTVMMVTKNLDDFQTKWISGQKTATNLEAIRANLNQPFKLGLWQHFLWHCQRRWQPRGGGRRGGAHQGARGGRHPWGVDVFELW